LLARREHSQKELQQKLRSKSDDADAIESVVAQLAEEGLLSNARFIENFIHFRKQKGYGPLRIAIELRERGISEEFITQHLNNREASWQEAAYQVWQKRFKNQVPSDFKTRAQQMRFLQYRGFTTEQIEGIYEILNCE